MRILRHSLLKNLKLHSTMLGMLAGLIVGGTLIAFFFFTHYQNKIFEGVFIDEFNVSGLTKDEALAQLGDEPIDTSTTVTLLAGEESIASSSGELGLHSDYSQALEQAYLYGRSDNLVNNFSQIAHAYLKAQQFHSQAEFVPQKVDQFIALLASRVNTPETPPSATITSGTVSINPGQVGTQLNLEATTQKVMESAPTFSPIIESIIDHPGYQLTTEEIQTAETRAQKYAGVSIHAHIDTNTTYLEATDLIALLAFPSGYSPEKIDTLLENLKESTDRPATNAKFSVDQTTLKVTEFQPDFDGLTIDTDKSRESLIAALSNIESGQAAELISLEIPVTAKPADIQLSDLNSLGINEAIGFGESNYRGSITSRVHNVSRASEILNNFIVAPGTEFSFNNALGDVSGATGFQQAYVIRAGQTVLGDGGGVCQVSTTLFRALLDSGVDISKRRAHSYRVGYYEQEGRIGDYSFADDPGFDATVYSGDVDLRFINNTPGHILIHFNTDAENRHMTVTIYGTDDGRETKISDFKTWGYSGPPPAQYTDDPSLPPGKVVQVDWAVAGIKSSFVHTITDKNGTVLDQTTYSSNYIPWAAKYRRGV